MSFVENPVKTLPSATRFLKQLKNKEISVTEYIRQCIKNVDNFESDVHAWAYFNREIILNRAYELDSKLDKKRATLGEQFATKLYGIPIGVKDIFNTLDMKTEHGSPIYSGYTPGNDARVVTDIRRSNGIVMGKTITAEFCVHTPGPTRNPHDLNRTPGTSSSGSAAAVACGMVPLALSSQTNGSTIRPASYCGIIGYKPSFGVLPRTAMLKTTDTLDTVGIMGSYLSDILMLFNVLRVKGLNYPIVNKKLVRYPKKSHRWKIGIINSTCLPKATDVIIDKLSSIGCEIDFFELPYIFNKSAEVHSTIYHRALAYYFKREWTLYPDKFSRHLADIIREGSQIDSGIYHNACQKQSEMIKAFDNLYNQFDIIMCPSAATEAPIGSDENIGFDYNHLITMCHVPTISLPLLKGPNNLPIGVQFVARKYSDYQLFDFCHHLLNEIMPHAIC